MTKREYMEELRKALTGLKKEEVNEIIEDYENHFQAGIADGKSEEELVAEFGNIEDLVTELKSFIPMEEKGRACDNQQEEKTYNRVEEQEEINAEGDCLNLYIDLICADVTLRMSEDNSMNMKYENNGSFWSKAKMRFSGHQEGDTFYAKETGSGSFQGNTELFVMVPKNCKSVRVQSKSGDMKIQNITGLDELRVKTMSGDIEVQGGNVQLASFETMSGDVELRNHDSSRLAAKTVSGDVRLEGTTYRNGSIGTVSGDAHVDELSKDAFSEVCSVSGDVTVIVRDAAGGNITTTSGDVKVIIEKECTGYEIRKKGMEIRKMRGGFGMNIFGDMHIRSNETVEVIDGAYCYGDRSCKLETASVSGNVSIVHHS